MHRMVKYVISWLRSLGHACVPYLDDGFYGEVGFVRTVRFRNFVVRTWEALGLRFNEKCDLLPFLSEEFLGVVVHLAADVPTFHVPLRKLPSLDVQLHDLLEAICDMCAKWRGCWVCFSRCPAPCPRRAFFPAI